MNMLMIGLSCSCAIYVGSHIVTVPVLILDRPVSILGPTIPELRRGSKKCPQLQYGDFHFVTPVNQLGVFLYVGDVIPDFQYQNWTSSIDTGCLVHPVSRLDLWYVQYQYWTPSIHTGCSKIDVTSIDVGHAQ